MWRRVPELALRLAASTALVLWVSLSFGADLVRPLQPLIAACVERLDPRFVVQHVQLVAGAEGDRLRLEANLAAPVTVRGQRIEPLGQGGLPTGALRVYLTVGGSLQYVDLLLIAVLAWPARRGRQWLNRVLLVTPFAALLWLVQVPPTFAAELWFGLSHGVGGQDVAPLMRWSRFLMGGGGAAIALLLAFATVRLADARSG